MDTDPADAWAQARDRLTYAREAVARLDGELSNARMRLASAEADEAEAWRELDSARRQIKADGAGK